MHRLVEILTAAAVVLLGSSAYTTWASGLDGHEVTPAPVALLLAALAAAVVLRLAGTTVRRLLSAVLLLLGAAAVLVAITARPDDLPTLDDVDTSLGVAPWLAAAGGVFLAAAGVLGVVTAARWRRPTTRYERDPAATMEDQWKAIDAGEDPTV